MNNVEKLVTTNDGYDLYDGDHYYLIDIDTGSYIIEKNVASERARHHFTADKDKKARFIHRKDAEIYVALHNSESLDELAHTLKEIEEKYCVKR